MAVASSRKSDEQQRRAPDRRFEGRERLAERFLDEDEPAERLDPLVRAEDLRSVLVATVRDGVGHGLRRRMERGVHLWERREVRMRVDQVDVWVCEQVSARVDGVRVSRRPDPRAFDDRRDEREVDVGYDDACSAGLCNGDLRVRLGAASLEVDRPEVPLLRARLDECLALREVDSAVGAIELERGDANTLSAGSVQVAQLADELLPSQQAVEVLIALRQARFPLVRSSAARAPRALGAAPA